MIYLAAAILPFGFVVLAAVQLARTLIAGHKAHTPSQVPLSM
jgi:hypothetical protein